MSDGQKNIMLAAGGTGGHVFPAEALSEVLKERGHKVYFATDVRGNRFTSSMDVEEIRLIDGATVFSKSPTKLLGAAFSILRGIWQSMKYIRSAKIDHIVGFGGYPSFAPLFAGFLLGKPIVLHEQNAVLGRANKVLAKLSKKVALSFDLTKFSDLLGDKKVVIGNPMRKQVLALSPEDKKPYEKGGRFKIVIFGGSQGAQIFTDVLPKAIEQMSSDQLEKLEIVQQCHEKHVESLSDFYQKLGVKSKISAFFSDMPEQILDADLVIARAGASSVTEIAYLGTASILVPLPGSLDADQANNAKNIVNVDGGILCKQADFSAEYLYENLSKMMLDASIINDAASNVRKIAKADAALRLADLLDAK